MDYLGLEVHFDNGLADADGADPKASLHWYHDVISRRGLV
jgi:hypothetical protein